MLTEDKLTQWTDDARTTRELILIEELRAARAEIKNKDEIFFKLQDLQTRTNHLLGEVLFENLTRANELRAARAQIKERDKQQNIVRLIAKDNMMRTNCRACGEVVSLIYRFNHDDLGTQKPTEKSLLEQQGELLTALDELMLKFNYDYIVCEEKNFNITFERIKPAEEIK